MLFNSFQFLLLFLPAAWLAFALAAHSQGPRSWVLIVASLVFYGYWDIRFVPLLAASTALNWLAAAAYFRTRKRSILVAAMAADLAVLGWFKYVNFALATIKPLAPFLPAEIGVILPLGISFFTFHHIIYLADCYAGRAALYRLRDYALYIVLFPQILSGPLVRHNEIVPQFSLDPWRDGASGRWARGFVLLVIGLAKKAFLADALARVADPLFTAAAAHHALGFAQSWLAALAFTFQIYFDFSGYSDMAIGIALLFGLSLPFNFDAPYRAANIQDFWRRWHMTLSRFLRDYLYIPLGGNRSGVPRQIFAVLATFLLGGLWHGAGWHFVVWGGLHGAAVLTAVAWRRAGYAMPEPCAWALTFLFVVFAWVFFRAPSLEAATVMLRAMANFASSGAVSLRPLPLIAIAAAVAWIGPTSQTVALERLKPQTWAALATAAGLIAVLLRLNGGLAYKFIYFQF
jgi:alginate O-acetyltransferase complex protein AlgI